MRRFPPSVRAAAAVLALFALMTPTGCGQGFDRGAAVDSFRRANPEVSGEQAGCVVDRLVERYGLDALVEELDADAPDPAFAEAQFKDMFACGVDGDVEAQIAEQLQANGVDPAEAPCVAEALTADLGGDDIDVLLSGEITEEFMAKFVDAMDRCGAIEG